MFAFIVRRIIQALIVMLVIGLVGFVIQNQIGDPVRDLVGERVTPAEREVIRDQLGLNDPFYVQYARFVKNAVRGDLGLSFFYKKPALKVIIAKAPATIELVIVTALLLIVISIPAGIYSAIYPKSWFSRFIMALSTIGVAIPVFLTAIALIYFF
jgi:peptide/nickel transport system permease protein